MTGFAGLIAPRDARPDPAVTGAMAAAIAYMGPDRQDSWHHDRVFLTHALFATTFEEAGDRQPATLDGAAYIMADARIDDRARLIGQLRDAGRSVADGIPDSALILHAWHVWGERCCEHLIGDFAFAIWDVRAERLFLARDQFGTVPCYYTQAGDDFLFGNAVPALLAHPRLDRALNRKAIGDYLLFGYSLDPTAGFYRHIDRLPPAHCMIWERGTVRTWRYWSLPAGDYAEWEHMPEEQIAERFGALLAEAVRDRLRTGSVATTLSGGMDSTLVTALAVREDSARIGAWSFGLDWLLPDSERHWAWQCAHHIGVPFHSLSVDPNYLAPAKARWHVTPEPRMELRASPFRALGHRLAEEDTRVLLMGMGGDVVTGGGHAHWAKLVRDRKYLTLAREAWQYRRYHDGRTPLRGAWKRARPAKRSPLDLPLNPDFIREQQLEERWHLGLQLFALDPREGMASSPFWAEMFVASHPESTRLPLRVRQPFFDVRLVEAAMRVPPTPWQFQKLLLRRVGTGLLPDSIVKRPKTAFGINPAWEAARCGLEPWIRDFAADSALAEFIDADRLMQIANSIEQLSPGAYSTTIMLPASLGAWLRSWTATKSG